MGSLRCLFCSSEYDRRTGGPAYPAYGGIARVVPIFSIVCGGALSSIGLPGSTARGRFSVGWELWTYRCYGMPNRVISAGPHAVGPPRMIVNRLDNPETKVKDSTGGAAVMLPLVAPCRARAFPYGARADSALPSAMWIGSRRCLDCAGSGSTPRQGMEAMTRST